MTKTCHACGSIVPETHQGKCPSCGKEEGYEIVRNITEVVKINEFAKTELEKRKVDPKVLSHSVDAILVKQKEIEKSLAPLTKILTGPGMKAFSERLEEVRKFSENLQKRISNTNILTTTTPDIPEKVIVSEEAVKETAEELKEIKDEIPKEKDVPKKYMDLLKEIFLKQDQTNVGIKQIINRLSPTSTILFGLGVGILGSIIGGFIVAGLTGWSPFPVDISTNMTNGTEP